nr:tetratricopeptide repeat protein [Acidobacteriota bacterium]
MESAERQVANIQTLEVIIVPRGSKALWTNARIEKQIAKLSDEIAKLKKEGDTPRPIDFGFYLREWAEQFGFTPEQVKAAFDEWAKAVEKSDDYRTLGLRAFYQNNFPLAAENFVKAAQKDEGQIKPVQEQLDRRILSAYQNRKDAANSLTNSYQFREALEQYNLAKLRLAEVISKDKHRYEQAEIEVLISNTKQELGVRVEGAEGNRLLSEAVDSHKRVLAVFTREQSPQDWAMTQNNLGNTLSLQGERMAGNEGVKRLAEAVAAFRNALQVYTREQLPQQWAETQNNLGNALSSQGERMAGDEGLKLLAEAVTTHRAALQVRTRERLPQDWAITQ